MRQSHVYMVDMSLIDGNGDFSCPKCGIKISPDDCTDETYTIIEARVNREDLDEIVIYCNNCASQVHLVGFSLPQELAGIDRNMPTQDLEEQSIFVNHI